MTETRDKRALSFSSFFLLIILGFSMSSCHPEQNVRIKGTLVPSDAKMIYADLLDVNTTQPVDSGRLRKGKFRMKVPLKEPSFLLLRVTDDNFITLLATPGEKIHILSDTLLLPAHYEVTGSYESGLVKMLDDHLRQTVHKTDSIANIYREAINKPGFDTLKSTLEDAYQKLINEQHKFSVAFILKHTHDLSSIKAIYQKIDNNTFVLNSIRDIQYMKILSDSLSKYYPDLRITKALTADYHRELSNYQQYRLNAMAQKSGTIGSMDLALPDPTGDTIRLSSLKGKYVLLSFWTSRSEQCVRENNVYRSLYDKYHNRGFEIYQVSLDTDRNTWSNAVRYYELPWMSVYDAGFPGSAAANMYNIQQPPRNFLINPEGDIVGTDLYDRNLRIKLGQIFEP